MINIVAMGGFTYPYGMAGTKRISNLLKALNECPQVTTRVVLQRQSSELNILSGVHEGTPYETIMGDVHRSRLLAAMPLLCYRTAAALHAAFRPGRQNIIYFYGPLFLDSIVPLIYARRLGYKIVFDVIEDFGLVKGVSRSLYERLRGSFANLISLKIKDLASGIIVISSHLEEKYRVVTQGKVPIHYLPVSVDMNFFQEKPFYMNPTITLFYAGNFSRKDGLPVLLDAFDKLAAQHESLRLVLTGRGDSASINEFTDRVDRSPYRTRVDYRGYLDEKEYYTILNAIDIPCMTRIDVAFAHAGFPFKLGEFLATGKPVIASRVSDVDRFLVNERDAILIDPGSVEGLCAAVASLIDNPEMARAIGRRGRRVASSCFDCRQQGKELLAFLQSI